MEPIYITTKQAAALSGFPVRTVYNWLHIEGFPAKKYGERAYRIHRERFFQWIEENIEQSAGQDS